MTPADNSLFRLPRQDLASPSQFDASSESLARWIEQLPKANPDETSRLLCGALDELNRVKLHPGLRLELLDLLRPNVHFCTTALSHHYLNQPIVMSDKARQIAELSHTLSDRLANGYILVALHADALARSDQGVELLLSHSLHRAIGELGEIILLHTQLYRDPLPGTWLKLHQMLLLAQQRGVDGQRVHDPLVDLTTTVTAAYLRVALLGAARPFQLRQADMTLLSKALQHWSPKAGLIDWPEHGLPVLAVNPADDLPPRLGTLLQDRPGQCFALQTDGLVAELQELFQQIARGALTVKIDHLLVPVDLLKHLIHAWSELSKRNFMRLDAHEAVELCLGLGATHHYLADGLDFEQLLADQADSGLALEARNRFLEQPGKAARQHDVWDSAYETNFGQINVSLATLDISGKPKPGSSVIVEEKFRSYQVHTINVSPGGYRIHWPLADAGQIRSGDIVGIREQRNPKWSIGVIRWAKNEAGSVHIGLELISPSAQPYGARIVQKTGVQGEFLRVLLLPELKALGQPASLITPNMPFKSQQKIVLRQRGKETIVQLDRRIAGNSVYSQFAFRGIGNPAGKHSDEPDDAPDKLWSTL